MTKSSNFYSSNKYRVQLTRLPDVELFCNKVTLPDVSVAYFELNGHLAGDDDMPSCSEISYGELVVTFIVDENLENYVSVLKWLKTISPDDDLYNIYPESVPDYEDIYTTTVSVFVKDNNFNTIGEFIYGRCIPVSLSGLELSVSEDLVMTANLTFRVNELDFEFKYSNVNTNQYGHEIPSYCEIKK